MAPENPARRGTALRRLILKVAQPVLLPMIVIFSATYRFPLTGFYYFMTSPVLWAHMGKIILPELMLSIGVLAVSFVFLYPIQAFFASFFNGPSGVITAFIAVLHESMVATQLLSSMFLLPKPLDDLFDTILSKEGFDDFVVKGKLRRQATTPTVSGAVKQLFRSAPRSILFPIWLISCIVKVSLHFLPIIGPMLLVILDGPKQARRCHKRYFFLKGFDVKQEEVYVTERRGQYLGFGIPAAALESIPILGLFFAYTNCTGAALWAVSVETKLRGTSRINYRGRTSR